MQRINQTELRLVVDRAAERGEKAARRRRCGARRSRT
jgi:hypothetical protein